MNNTFIDSINWTCNNYQICGVMSIIRCIFGFAKDVYKQRMKNLSTTLNVKCLPTPLKIDLIYLYFNL